MLPARLGWMACFVLLLSWPGGSLVHASGDAAARPAPAAAAPNPLTSSPPEPTTRLTSWYGYQILLADAASIGLGLLADSPEVLIAGYLVGPVILHGVHRRAGLAVLSPMMRLFLPAIGIAIGTQFRTCNANGDECAMGGFLWGGGIGAAAALILDWSLGWEVSAVPPAVDHRPVGLALTAAGLAPSGDGFSLMLGGRF